MSLGLVTDALSLDEATAAAACVPRRALATDAARECVGRRALWQLATTWRDTPNHVRHRPDNVEFAVQQAQADRRYELRQWHQRAVTEERAPVHAMTPKPAATPANGLGA